MTTPPPYMAASAGTGQLAFWDCLDCRAKRRRRHGQDHDEFRATAVAHIEDTGHVLTLFRGTEELLHGLSTALPAPEAIAS